MPGHPTAYCIEELKTSIPKGTPDTLVANARTLSPAALLTMVAE